SRPLAHSSALSGSLSLQREATAESARCRKDPGGRSAAFAAAALGSSPAQASKIEDASPSNCSRGALELSSRANALSGSYSAKVEASVSKASSRSDPGDNCLTQSVALALSCSAHFPTTATIASCRFSAPETFSA